MQRNRDTEEPGAGNLLARTCGGAGEATPQLYPDADPDPGRTVACGAASAEGV